MPYGTPGRLSTCTIQRRNGKFCDAPSAEDAPYPICAHHAEVIAWWVSDTEDDLPRDHIFRQMVAGKLNRDIDASIAEAAGRRDREQAAYKAQCVVYYVKERDGNIKIGTTNNLRRRLAALRLPAENVLATEPGSRDLERMRHAQFADARYGRSEVFHPSLALMSHIEMLRDHFGEPVITQYLPEPRGSSAA